MSRATEDWTERLIDQRVVVLVGSGGVGKTTTSAAIGLHAARRGRRVLVLTIDPARRLADALGLEAIGNAETQVALDHAALPDAVEGGSMHAMMLDTEGAFDDLVSRLASDPGRAKAVQDNRIYRHIIDSLAGAQEYLAGEKIFDAASSGRYDLVVLDTPPTANALEFLDASRRLVRLLDDRVYRWLLPTATDGGAGPGLVDRLLRAPSNVAKAILARVFGERFVDDLEEFFLVMQGIHSEVRRRSEDVQRLLRDPAKTSFLLVTAPISSVTDNAVFFHDQIRTRGYPFAGFIINRVHPSPASEALEHTPASLASALSKLRSQGGDAKPGAPGTSSDDLTALSEALLANATRMSNLADRDRTTIERLRKRMTATAPTTLVPRLAGAIHDLPGLASVGDHIFTPG